jgi:hypothetical protein
VCSAVRYLTLCLRTLCSLTHFRSIRDYATKRIVMGRPLSESALYLRTVTMLEVVRRGCLQLCLRLCLWLGEEERGTPSATQKEKALLLRILTPIAKAFVR